MNNKKNIIILSIGVLILVFGLILFYLHTNNFANRLASYITSKGYVFDNGSLYIKESASNSLRKCNIEKTTKDCEGSATYFDVENYMLIQNTNIIEDKVGFELSYFYDYQTEELTYTYRITYQNSVLIIKGDNNKCLLEYVYGTSFKDYKTICNSFEDNLNDFKYESKMLIQSSAMLNKMKK